MPDPRPLTAVVCDVDSWNCHVMAQLVTAAGFDVLAEVAQAIEAIRMAEAMRPSLVVILHEQSGVTGIEAVPDFLAVDPPAEVLLVAGDTSLRAHAKAIGAFDVTVRGDVEMTTRLLGEVRELLETGERRVAGDRRAGEDRREHQDWSKVTHERREAERRAGSRRDQDATAGMPPDLPDD